jgi:hypothetical protein
VFKTETRKQQRHSRGDALPEHLEYRDTGCSVSSSCLGCPLPRCRYDMPGGARAILNQARDAEIRRLYDDTSPSARSRVASGSRGARSSES